MYISPEKDGKIAFFPFTDSFFTPVSSRQKNVLSCGIAEENMV